MLLASKSRDQCFPAVGEENCDKLWQRIGDHIRCVNLALPFGSKIESDYREIILWDIAMNPWFF